MSICLRDRIYKEYIKEDHILDISFLDKLSQNEIHDFVCNNYNILGNISLTQPRRWGKSWLCWDIYNNLYYRNISSVIIVNLYSQVKDYIQEYRLNTAIKNVIILREVDSWLRDKAIDFIIFDDITLEERNNILSSNIYQNSFHIWTPR